MPNWCSNTLNVTGPREAVEAFISAARGPGATYNEFHGEEWEAFEDTRKKVLASNIPEPGPVQDLSFHALYPVPEDVRRFGYDDGQATRLRASMDDSVVGIYGNGANCGGYGWETNHWGVKWGASDVNLTTQSAQSGHNIGGATMATYEFETPWGPPDGLLYKVSKDFPGITFSLQFLEPGMGFEGRMEWKDGEQTVDESWDYQEENC